MDIIDLVQQEINKITNEQYSEHLVACIPVFTASLYNRTVIITCVHAGRAFSKELFPEQDMTYGLSTIEDVMNSLYARTM